MLHGTKIATCNYCGTKAALVLRRGQRLELACSNCGAPLHELKAIKAESVTRPEPSKSFERPNRKIRRKPQKRRRSELFDDFWEEAFEFLEDIID